MDKKRAKMLFSRLKKLFPKAGMILQYSNPWELLVAVELSAQCTDVRVNIVTKKLFKKYPTLNDYINANPKEFERDIFQTGFYKNKTKNILAAARVLREKFSGELPKTMGEMLTIPGVGRKTANVVLGNAHGLAEGIAVDTHVMRLAQVLGLSKHKTPEKIEQDLMKLIPQKEWFRSTYLLIDYGRAYCTAKPHNHAECPLGGELIGYARGAQRASLQKKRRAS